MDQSSPLPREADVVIIGGGIVGAGAAYHLAGRGISTVLLEKGAIAGEQSSRNWGWVRQNGRNLNELPLGIASRRLWESLESELGEHLGWAQSGNIDLALDGAELDLFRRWQDGAARLGLETAILSEGEVRERLPGIRGRFAGGILSPTDGQADPHRVAPALARHAGHRGAAVVEGIAVESVLVEHGTVNGVRTERGDIRAPVVVVAAGAWSTRLLWKLGIKLPQRPIRNTVLATTPAPAAGRTVAWAEGCALRQDDTGRYILSGGGRSDTDLGLDMARFARWYARPLFDARRRGEVALHAGRETLTDLSTAIPGTGRSRHPWRHVRAGEPRANLRNAWRVFSTFRELFPSLEGVGIERVWAGHIDYTPDAVPVIQRLTQPRGLVIATGFSGHGFALGPGGGLLAAQLAAGDEPMLDLHAFRLARFAERLTNADALHF